MPEQEMGWREAILKVLKEAAGKPLHTDEITAEILNRGLKSTAGKTPSITVAAIISRLRGEGQWDIVKSQPGYFYMRAADDTSATSEQEESDDELAVTDEPENLAVAAYGLYWERDKVDWSARHLYGCDTANSNPVGNYSDFAIDFADQQGVYLLHSWDAVVYVGRTTAETNGLFQRLQSHLSGRVWSAKWVRFSWFGLRPVSNTGELKDVPDMATKRVVSALMESVLIETLRPAFNSQKGDYVGTLYRQLVDPGIAEREARAWLQHAAGVAR